MNLIIRIFKSLRARSFKTNCSTWYLAKTENPKSTNVETKSPLQQEFRILEGDKKELIHQWLIENRARYPWVYFPEEIISSNQNKHWYPCIFDGDRLIAWVKLARNNVFIHDFESTIALPANCAFIYDTFVDPEYRQKGLGHTMIEQLKSYLATQHYKAVACHIEDWNTPSIKVFTKSGFKPIGKIRYLRLTFFRWLIIDGKPRSLVHLTSWLGRKILAANKNI